MTVVNFEELAHTLRAKYPDGVVDLRIFGLQGAALSIIIGEDLFVIEYAPGEGYGVSRIKQYEGFLRGSDHVFLEFDGAAAMLQQLLEFCAAERSRESN